jgi:RNA methyltransferase, TrmH family
MITKATVKYIQSLQHKKFRDEFNTFFAEGPKVVCELLKFNYFECEAIYCTQKCIDDLPKTLTDRYAKQFNIIENFELEKISALSVANGILAVFIKKNVPQSLNIANALTIMLDDIQDPGNLGTIIRIADWFGVATIFCSHATADCYNPKVVQSTMASLGRVNVIYDDLISVLQKAKNIKKFGAFLEGEDVKNVGKLKEGIIIIGNESKGISSTIKAIIDTKITIARVGDAESLNAAVAAGIIMHAIT